MSGWDQRGDIEDFEDEMHRRVGRCDSVEGGIRCRGLKGHLPPHWGPRNPGDSLIGNKRLYGILLTPQARTIFWIERGQTNIVVQEIVPDTDTPV